jgi:hypothetical protein
MSVQPVSVVVESPPKPQYHMSMDEDDFTFLPIIFLGRITFMLIESSISNQIKIKGGR